MGSDPTLDRLLDLDGVTIVIHPDGYWVKFTAKLVNGSQERPHGLHYSLTLHGPDGERIVGFDNAHPVPPKKWGDAQDHHHRSPKDKGKPYVYTDAAQLLSDFWHAVDAALHDRGITP